MQMNIAIGLTLSRFVLLPMAVLPLILNWNEGWLISSTITFLAGLSDFADGYLARKLKLTTLLGANLDYICDKVFIGGMLITLASFQLIPVWIPIVVLVRELTITLLRIKRFNPRPLATDIWGKAKTTVSFTAITWFTLQKELQVGNALNSIDTHVNLSGILSLASWVMLMAVILTLISGINYLWKFNKMNGLRQ
jgi:CDP-diacylglycerol--glycerol-3-phosphate 3-phosphatidyltransferase